MASASDFWHSWRWGREYFADVRPIVTQSVEALQRQAALIPDANLRGQALSSLVEKRFHCEGGGVFGGPSRDPAGRLLQFLVPYQTLCDYLDTVTDRGPSQDPDNLRLLHQSLLDAVVPGAPLQDYYRLHPDKADGGYAKSLVQTCQTVLASIPDYPLVQDQMTRLVGLYVDLQVFKHGPAALRVPLLTQWYEAHHRPEWDLRWYEFAAAAGSTLGLFALLTAVLEAAPTPALIERLYHLYFPWIGSLHILLDYLIDQREDALGGDLNFVSFYASGREATDRIRRIYRKALEQSRGLSDAAFHRYVARGLLGFYLSDRKVQKELNVPACALLASGGGISIGVWLAARIGRSP